MNKKQYISLIVEKIKQENPEKIILFGSHAYGKPGKESDVDILVIKNIEENKIRDFRIKLKMLLWEIIIKENVPVDILVDNQERINQRINDGDMFYQEIMTKGNVLYA
ncbi:MAG: nucleotidyltransferase domain-containing protein [Bacteroidales bacterium]|nr:nucleotidyltransferase domain-containing protein [Bacteroidales bacterium]